MFHVKQYKGDMKYEKIRRFKQIGILEEYIP